MAERSRFPAGRRGGRTAITNNNKVTEDRSNQHFKPDEDMTGPLASVGMSLSAGSSQNYGEVKWEVSAWCTLPCKPTEQDIVETYSVCYDFCKKEVERRCDEAEALIESVVHLRERR